MKVRAVSQYETATTFLARDGFTQTAGTLSGKSADVGGKWGAAGDADGFTVDTTGKTAQRTAVSDAVFSEKDGHFAPLGTSNYTDIAAQADVKTSNTTSVYQGVIARYTDVNNWVIGRVLLGSGVATAAITKCVAGTPQHITNPVIPTWDANSWRTVRLVVFASGSVELWGFPEGRRIGKAGRKRI